MKGKPKMVLYISGPMSNLPGKNHAEFNKWAKLLRDRGHQVLNPAENDGGSTDKAWSYYMELDMNSVLISQALVLLPGWEFSNGAKIEIAVAQAIGRPIYLIDEFMVNRNPQPLDLKIRIIIDP